ncbi:hypothetical protein [Bacillus infantis]|uniref:hypothetical protein n=1 Tax=Bacillus infantis TaxID=324767 RepID=UPI003CEE0CFF
MHMQIKGWTQFKSLVGCRVVYHHVVVLWLYMLLRNDAMLKEGVACGGIMLISKQFVRSIQLLRECTDSAFDKATEKARSVYGGAVSAWFFIYVPRCGGVFVYGRKQVETEEASTAGLQSKNRQNSFLLTACESVMKDS